MPGCSISGPIPIEAGTHAPMRPTVDDRSPTEDHQSPAVCSASTGIRHQPVNCRRPRWQSGRKPGGVQRVDGDRASASWPPTAPDPKQSRWMGSDAAAIALPVQGDRRRAVRRPGPIPCAPADRANSIKPTHSVSLHWPARRGPVSRHASISPSCRADRPYIKARSLSFHDHEARWAAAVAAAEREGPSVQSRFQSS